MARFIPFNRKSERYSSEGGTSGEAVIQNLGRPRMDSATILLREAVQNSWDARLDREHGHIEVNIELRTITPDQLGLLTDVVFQTKPADHPLQNLLQDGLQVLTIQDKYTTGLNGPIFHEKIAKASQDQPRNFIRFVRQIGRGAFNRLGGGTYGFGKSIFYNVSQAGTCLIHTRCTEDGKQSEERLIAQSITRPSEDEQNTGRHWWGVKEKKGIAPQMGRTARALARHLGLPQFQADETGTTIAILAPRMGDEVFEGDESKFVQYLAETLVYWCWPRMLPLHARRPAIRFSVRHEGRKVAIPDPEQEPPFKNYTRAFRNLLKVQAGAESPVHQARVVPVEAARPQARLGYCSMESFYAVPRRTWIAAKLEGHPLRGQLAQGADASSRGRSHHVALMRFPWQIVNYLTCHTVPLADMEYAGVFLVDGDPLEVEEAFAQAEPPTHDGWVPDVLANRIYKTWVRVAHREVRRIAQEFVQDQYDQTIATTDDPLDAISHDLGDLILIQDRMRKRVQRTSKKAQSKDGSRSGKPGVRLFDEGRLELLGQDRTARFSFELTGVIPEEGIVVRGYPRVVVMGGGKEFEAPAGASKPQIVQWLNPKGKKKGAAESIALTPQDDSDGLWTIVISVPDDTLVGVSLQLDELQVESEAAG
jgi:hypothetical protein